MPVINFSLQEGFQNDLVIIRINGQEVVRRDQVSTKLLFGYAESIATEVPAGEHMIEISLPKRNLTATIPLHVISTSYIGISVATGRIDYIVSPAPFGFM